MQIQTFEFKPGRLLAGKYKVQSQIGAGVEGEVYRVTEARTGIDRAAKIFFPHRNVKDRAVRVYANKLERLRECPIVMQYHHAEAVRHRGVAVTCMISELVPGELLSTMAAKQRGGRFSPFEAMHLLHALVVGLDEIHGAKEYHGDIHPENILVARKGISFAVKLIDFHDHGRSTAYHRREDLIQLIRVFHECVGGRDHYARQPKPIKAICCGLRADLIRKRFPTTAKLRLHLESFAWD